MEVSDYRNKKTKESINSKVRTLKTFIISNKKAPEGAISLNGAGDGTLHELFKKVIFPAFISTESILLDYAIKEYQVNIL